MTDRQTDTVARFEGPGGYSSSFILSIYLTVTQLGGRQPSEDTKEGERRRGDTGICCQLKQKYH